MIRALDLLGQCTYEHSRILDLQQHQQRQKQRYLHSISLGDDSTVTARCESRGNHSEIGSSLSSDPSCSRPLSSAPTSCIDSTTSTSSVISTGPIEPPEPKDEHCKSPYFVLQKEKDRSDLNDKMRTRSQAQSSKASVDANVSTDAPFDQFELSTPPTPPETPLRDTRRRKRQRTDIRQSDTDVQAKEHQSGEEGGRPPTPESLVKSRTKRRRRKQEEKEVVVEIPSIVQVEIPTKNGDRNRTSHEPRPKKGKNVEAKEKKGKREKQELSRKGEGKGKASLGEEHGTTGDKEEIVVQSEKGVLEHVGKIHLIQEKLRYDPWRMLIATCLLNKTAGRAARPILEILLERYPTPKELSEASIPDLSTLLYPLGLFNQRASSLIRFSRQYLDYNWPLYPPPPSGHPFSTEHIPLLHPNTTISVPDELDVKIFYGSGVYASDSFRIYSHLLPGKGAPEHEAKWLKKGERARERMRSEGGWDGSVERLSGHLSDSESESDSGSDCAQGEDDEWRKVIPLDKELRRYLIWRWGIEGIVYDIHTGPRIVKERDKERLKYLLKDDT